MSLRATTVVDHPNGRDTNENRTADSRAVGDPTHAPNREMSLALVTFLYFNRLLVDGRAIIRDLFTAAAVPFCSDPFDARVF